MKKEEVQHAQANDTIKRCVERLVSKGSNNLFSLLLVFFLDEDDGVCFRYKQMYLHSCLLSLHSSRVSPRLCILLSSLALRAIAYLGRVDRDRVKRERERDVVPLLRFLVHSSWNSQLTLPFHLRVTSGIGSLVVIDELDADKVHGIVTHTDGKDSFLSFFFS